MAAIIAALACTQIANHSGLIFIRHLTHREDVLGRRCLTHHPLRTAQFLVPPSRLVDVAP